MLQIYAKPSKRRRLTIFKHGLLCCIVQPKLIIRVILYTDSATLDGSAPRVIGNGSKHVVFVFVVIRFGIVDTFSGLR